MVENAELSPWSKAIGPVYTTESLPKHGIEISDDLIGLTTIDGHIVYPQAQFDVLPDNKLRKREAVLKLWNDYIRPAIEHRAVDGWTAGTLLFSRSDTEPSYADLVSSDPSEIQFITDQVRHTVDRWLMP